MYLNLNYDNKFISIQYKESHGWTETVHIFRYENGTDIFVTAKLTVLHVSITSSKFQCCFDTIKFSNRGKHLPFLHRNCLPCTVLVHNMYAYFVLRLI